MGQQVFNYGMMNTEKKIKEWTSPVLRDVKKIELTQKHTKKEKKKKKWREYPGVNQSVYPIQESCLWLAV